MPETVRQNPEPDREPYDPHAPPLDDENDARWLDPIDPRRRQVEERRGRAFNAEEEQPPEAEFDREGD